MDFSKKFSYFCISKTKKLKAMKVKLSKEQIQKIVDDPQKAQEAGIKASDPWWVIALKVISYLIGLILAGVATASCSSAIGII